MNGDDAPAGALALAHEAQARCDHATAETWGGRAALLAERDGDPVTLYRARRAVGWSWYERGDFRRAARLLRRALNTAEAAGLEAYHGPAAADLFIVLALVGEYGAAEELRARAERGLPPGHPRRYGFTNDTGVALLVGGDGAGAVRVLAPLAEGPAGFQDALTIRANLTAALAAAGNRPDGLRSARRLREMLSGGGGCPAWGWYCLALALAGLGNEGEARNAAGAARRIAATAGERFTRERAAALLRRLS